MTRVAIVTGASKGIGRAEEPNSTHIKPNQI